MIILKEDDKKEVESSSSIFLNSYIEKLNSDNKVDGTTSIMSMLIDCLGILSLHMILKDSHATLQQYIFPFMVKNNSRLQYEIIKCADIFKSEDEDFNILLSDTYIDIIKNVRMKLKQYENSNFRKRKKDLYNTMGTSKNKEEPRIDVSIFYHKEGKYKFMLGTSHSYYDINGSDKKTAIMKEVYRNGIALCDKVCFYSNLDIIKLNSNITTKSNFVIKNFPYSFIDFLNNNSFKDKNIIDRLINMYDETGYIVALFSNYIDCNNCNNLLLLSFSKIISIVFTETVKNIKNYLNFAEKNEDYNMLNNLIANIDERILNKSKILRNNLHYNKQNKVFENFTEIKPFYFKIIEENYILHKKIEILLNIKLSIYKKGLYKLVRWSKYGYYEK